MNKWKTLLACGALCATSQFAFAGGPEMPPPGHSTIFIGLGGAYDYAQYVNTIGTIETIDGVVVFDSGNQWQDNRGIFGLAPIGQLGYEYFFGTGGFIGIKGLFNFVDKNTSYSFDDETYQAVYEVNSMVQAMLEGGFCFNNNAVYLEGGYAALFTKLAVRNIDSIPFGGLVLGSVNQTLNGGVVGIGYRHYFWDVLSLDLAYSYSLYADPSSFTPSQLGIGDFADYTFTEGAQSKRVRVQDIVLTVNYNFDF